ncbi:hypothetical protein TKK_0019591 [Trichogramma kaykai]|uniref:Uncharacterized protein n=1 Tax=Trichogramma kaykai TaxID=54128 RepID=A0ABD2VSA2_9HYME
MPRAVRDSDDETELRSSVRTRVRAASTTSNTDSPRRSTRNMKASTVTGSSPESIDEAIQNTTGRATRSKTANLDKSIPAGSGRTLRSRMNSASSDVSENWTEPDVETLPKRVTRKAATSAAAASPRSLRTRAIRAVSEAKATPPAVRSRRVTRASSVDQGASETETPTPVKRRTRASMVPLQPTVFEEHEAKTKAYRSLENTVIEIDEDDDLVIPCSQTKRRSKVILKKEPQESEESKCVKELNIESENSTSDSSKIDEESMNDKSIKVAENKSTELIDEYSLESCAHSNNSTLKDKESTSSQSTAHKNIFHRDDPQITNKQIELINIEDDKLVKYVEFSSVEQLSNYSSDSVIEVCDQFKKKSDTLLEMKKVTVTLNRNDVSEILAEKVKKDTLKSLIPDSIEDISYGSNNDETAFIQNTQLSDVIINAPCAKLEESIASDNSDIEIVEALDSESNEITVDSNVNHNFVMDEYKVETNQFVDVEMLDSSEIKQQNTGSNDLSKNLELINEVNDKIVIETENDESLSNDCDSRDNIQASPSKDEVTELKNVESIVYNTSDAIDTNTLSVELNDASHQTYTNTSTQTNKDDIIDIVIENVRTIPNDENSIDSVEIQEFKIETLYNDNDAMELVLQDDPDPVNSTSNDGVSCTVTEAEGAALSCSPNKSERNTSDSPLKSQVEKTSQIPDSDTEDEDHLFQDINEEEWIAQKEKSSQKNNEDQSSSKDTSYEYREDEENKSPNKLSNSRLENSTSKTENTFENINSSNLKDSLNKSTRKSMSKNSVQQISLMEVDEDSQNEADISMESQKKDSTRKSMNKSKKLEDSENEMTSTNIFDKSPKGKNQSNMDDDLDIQLSPKKSFNKSPSKNLNNRKSSQMNISAAQASPEKKLEKCLGKSPKNKKGISLNESLTQGTPTHSESSGIMVLSDMNNEHYSEGEIVAQFCPSSSPDELMKKIKKNRKSCQLEESVVTDNPESSPDKSSRKSLNSRKASPMKKLDVQASAEKTPNKSLKKSPKNRKSCQLEESVVTDNPESSPDKSSRKSLNNEKTSPMKELDVQASSEKTPNKSLKNSPKNRKSCQLEGSVVQDSSDGSSNKSFSKSPNNRKTSPMKELDEQEASPEKTSNKSLIKGQKSDEDSDNEEVSENEMQSSSHHKNDSKLEKESNSDKSNRKSIRKTPPKSNEDCANVESCSRKSLNKSTNKSLNASVISVKSTTKSMLEEPPERDDSDLTDQDKRLAENIEQMKTENPPKLDFSTLAQCDSSSDEENDAESQYIFEASSVSSNNGKNESETEDEKNSIDSDIANELNLAGDDIDQYEDDNEPADDCAPSNNESSDDEDDEEDFGDFIVPDDQVEESADSDSEEDKSEVDSEQESDEEAGDEPQDKKNVSISKVDDKNKSNNKSRNLLSDESSGSESDDEGTEKDDKKSPHVFMKNKSMNDSRKSIKDKSLNHSIKNKNISNIEQTKSEIKNMNKSEQNKSLDVSNFIKDKMANVSVKENQNKSISKSQDSSMDVDDNESESESELSVDTKSVEIIKDKSLDKSKLSIKNKSLNISKSGKDKSMNNSLATEPKDENIKKSLKDKSCNDSKSVFGKSLLNESKSSKNKDIDSSNSNSSGSALKKSDLESELCNQKEKPNDKSVNMSVKDKSLNISKSVKDKSLNISKSVKDKSLNISKNEKKNKKSLESLSGSDIELQNIDSSPGSESEEGEDSYHIVDADDMNPLKSKNKKLLIECSTPKPGVMKKTERFSNASDSFYEDKSSIAKSKRKSGSLNDLSETKGVTKISTENASKSILDTNETPDALKSRQKWKLIPLNQSALPSGVDTPVTKFLKKAKLNDSLPALPLQDTREEAEDKKSEKKKSKNDTSAQDEVLNHSNEHKNLKRKSLVNVSKVSENSIIAVDEKSKRVEEKQSDSEINTVKEKKKNKKNKNKNKNKESDLKVVETIEKQSQLVEDVSESKQKKKKKNKEIKSVEKEVDDTIKIEENLKKNKRKLTDVEDSSKQIKKQKSKHEATTSENDETLKLALRTLEKLNSKGLKKPKKAKSPVMSDSDDEAPESLDVKKARESAMAAMKSAAESVKMMKEARRKKHEEIIERKSVKRLPDDFLNELDEQPVQHREKRRKINKNDERAIMPSKSMFSPGKMIPQNLKVEDAYVPLSSAGGTTEFGVVDLEKAKKVTKKSSAFSFRDKMLSRNQRMPMKSYLSQQLKSKSKSSL